MNEKRFRFEKECTENFFTEKGVFYYNERPMGANEIIALLNSLYDKNEQLKAKASSWKITASKEGVEKAELMKQIVSLKEENGQLRQEKESWKNIACQDLSKWSIFSKEVSVLHETRDIERFLEKYYEYCADMVMNDE